jgi:prevent-host-death family protein
MSHIWQLQEAKNKLSELVSEAENEGPQIITRHGEQVAVVLSIDEYSRLTKPKTDLVEFFQSSPLAKVELDLHRDRSLDRDALSL